MKTFTILLIEDNPRDVRLIQEMLKEISHFKFNLLVSTTLKDGCEQIHKNNIDIILLDLNLPDSTGQQTFVSVLLCCRNIPIVLVSGLEDEELSLKLIKEGAQDYLTKQGLNAALLVRTIQYSSERKQAQMELKNMAEKWNATFNSISDIISIISKDHEFIEINKAGCEALGKDRKDILGKKCFELVHQLDHPLGNCPCSHLLSTKESKIEEIFENGRYYQLSAWPIFDDKSEFVAFSHSIKDITESKRLLVQIEEERNKLTSLINSIPDEVWFTDTQKKFTLANPSALNEFGLKNSDNIDVERFAKSLEIFRPDGSSRPVEEAPPLRALTGEEVKNLEEVVLIPSRQELRHRQVNASPVRDANGNIIGAISVVRDITDRKRAEEAIKQQLKEMQEWHEVSLGREERIIELKNEINSLLKTFGKKEKYETDL
jgi:PAS domain S-box-containing protein